MKVEVLLFENSLNPNFQIFTHFYLSSKMFWSPTQVGTVQFSLNKKDLFWSIFGSLYWRNKFSFITVFWNKLEIVLYTLFVQSCPTKLTGLYRTVSPMLCGTLSLLWWYKPKWRYICYCKLLIVFFLCWYH